LTEDQNKELSGLYTELYGITEDRPKVDLTFDSALKYFDKYIKKNKTMMKNIIKKQLKLLKKVDNK
jgi:hypothetical protein